MACQTGSTYLSPETRRHRSSNSKLGVGAYLHSTLTCIHFPSWPRCLWIELNILLLFGTCLLPVTARARLHWCGTRRFAGSWSQDMKREGILLSRCLTQPHFVPMSSAVVEAPGFDLKRVPVSMINSVATLFWGYYAYLTHEEIGAQRGMAV